MTTDVSLQIALLVLLGAILATLVYIAWKLKRVFTPTLEQRLDILRDRAAFNLKLVDEKNKRLLTRFAYSEASIATHLEDLANENVEMDSEALEITKDNKTRWQRFKGWLGKNSETLVGKINDIAKSAIGLGGASDA